MRTTTVALFLTLSLAAAPAAQIPKSATPEAKRANDHYQKGWEFMRTEAWADAARQFQQAIDNDPRFGLAYYSLGRAQMGLRDFPKAIASYSKCRELYVTGGGERYIDQMATTRSIEDRILELRAALRAAQNAGLKSTSQSQQLYMRELQNQIDRLDQARERNLDLSVDPQIPYFLPMALGAAYFRSGQFADAEREYKIAIEANPASGETHSNLAVLYLTTDRLDQAEKEIKAAEETGFKVNPALKDDLMKKKKTAGY